MSEKEKLVNDALGVNKKGYIVDDYVKGVTKETKDDDDDENGE